MDNDKNKQNARSDAGDRTAKGDRKTDKKKFHHRYNRRRKPKPDADKQGAEVIESAQLETEPIQVENSFEQTEESLGFLEDSPMELDDEPAIPIQRPPVDENEEKVEVIGIRFKRAGKVYYFSPEGIKAEKGDHAIVDTARGLEFGEVFIANKLVGISEIVPPLRPMIRIATREDISHNLDNTRREREAFATCLEQIEKHGLDMKLVDAQYTFDNSKLLFYFTSAGRVDFRELVKDLAGIFRTRIELRQIGIRDEAKLIGGLGACGRPLCCSTFLSDFVQVSIKMAKEQGLFLNSSKISGTCGRLMCCLRYEHDTYEYEIARTPAVDTQVTTPDGVGVVVEARPLSGTVKVRLTGKDGEAPKLYNRADVKPLTPSKKPLKEQK